MLHSGSSYWIVDWTHVAGDSGCCQNGNEIRVPSKAMNLLTTVGNIMVFKEDSASFLYLARQPPVGQGLLIHEVSRSHNDASQSVGHIWTRD
jgi:hypothetical protein